jgi:hypothetical protein
MQNKLNIFALPSQTTVLFAIIVTVLIGTLILGSIGSSPVLIWPISLSIVVLSLRSYIGRPEKLQITCKKADNQFLLIKQSIAKFSHDVGLTHIPELYISKKEGSFDVYALGSFRRKYIIMSEISANKWEKQLSNSHEKEIANAGIIHELFHLKNGDDWKLDYARELLRMTFMVMLWGTVCFAGLVSFLQISLPDILHYDFSIFISKIEKTVAVPTELSELFLKKIHSMKTKIRKKLKTINLKLVLHFIVNSFLPFITITSILWLFYLRKLRRTREFYADAGAIMTQKDIHPIYCFLSKVPIKKQTTFHESYSKPQGLMQRIKELISNHPDFIRRKHAWINPVYIYDDPIDTALLIGIFSVIMDIIILSPLSIPYFYENPMLFSMLASLVLIGIRLIPYIVLGEPVNKNIFVMVGIFTLLRLIVTFLILSYLTILFFTSPEYLSDMLSTAVASFSRYAGSSNKGLGIDINEFISQAIYFNLPQPFIISVVTISFLMAIGFVFRKVLRWYNFPTKNNNVSFVLYVCIFFMCMASSSVLTLITSVFLDTTKNLFLWGTIFCISFFFGIILIVCDRLFSDTCPKCNHINSGHYYLGKVCLNCKTKFNSWLLT